MPLRTGILGLSRNKQLSRKKDTLRVKRNPKRSDLRVTDDGQGLVSHAGVDLLYRTAAVTGLEDALRTRLGRFVKPRSLHHPGKIILDLMVMLAAGGDCPADVGMVAHHNGVFGIVASDPTISRLITELAGDPSALRLLRTARADSRRQANQTHRTMNCPDTGASGEVIVDIDASLITAHSEKQDAAPNYKRGFGFHPLLAYLDHGQDGTGEGLAGIIRAGNANAGKASDHLEVLDLIVDQLDEAERKNLVLRTDTAASNHEFLHVLSERGFGYSVGFAARGPVARAIGQVPASAWIPAVDADDQPRDGAWVAELTDLIELGSWPTGMRVIARKERPHPGAQLRLTDVDGHRITCFATNHTSTNLPELELRHRRRARCEDRIRNAKDTGLHNLPYHGVAANQIWIELVLTAQTLTAHLQLLALDGPHKVAEPKRLRLHLFSVAARYVRTGRRRILRIDQNWPWTDVILAAVTRLNAIRAPG